jgi:hypothetical protein
MFVEPTVDEEGRWTMRGPRLVLALIVTYAVGLVLFLRVLLRMILHRARA